jgi:hypothetical protein
MSIGSGQVACAARNAASAAAETIARLARHPSVLTRQTMPRD